MRVTKIFPGILDHPSAWTAASLGGKAEIVRTLDASALAAFDKAAIALHGKPFSEISRADLSDPALAGAMTSIRAAVMDGPGLALLRGPDPARYDPEDYARLYFAMGAYLGCGVVQSYNGDYVARVERNPNLPWRGTTTDMELRPHTDFHEVMSLASVSLPISGGVSAFVSSLAIHNVLAREQPELLPPLYEGWYNLSPLERTPSARKVPVYSWTDGKLSCFFNRVFYQKAEEASEPMPKGFADAIAAMDEIALRPEMRAEFTLEPGEVVFWHNFQVLHARTAFEDSDAQRRLLLRLWLNVDGGARPMAEEIRERARLFDRDHVAGARAPVKAQDYPGRRAATLDWPGRN